MTYSASIIILTYNNLEYTRLCLESIERHSAEPPYEVILVDNASQDDTPQFLRAYAEGRPNVKVLLNRTNLGFARGNNQGAAEASGEHLVFLNNDIVVTAGWLPGLLRRLEDPTVGMVGPVTNSSANETRIRTQYEDLEEMERFAAEYTRAHSGEAFEIAMLPLQCAALRREVFEQVGPLDERFGTGMFEDDDYALRLREAGYRILCVEDVFVHHWGSASFSKLARADYWALFRQNLAKFEEKWGTRWIPHRPREEFLPEHLRGNLDSVLWLNDVIADREHNLQLVEEQLNLKSAELRWIYESNGWAFLQALLRVRRRLVPEGSRRERFFRLALQTLRDFRPARLRAAAREARSLLRPEKPQIPALAAPVALGGAGAEQSGQVDRFPWPLVSVILPVYNHADMLEGAAHSVLYGSYPFVELIILDDGSTDEIEPVLRRLSRNPRVRIFRQPNQKLPRALTHAHAFASGEFITWSSSDNLLGPTAIEHMVRALLEHPEAVLVYADVSLINEAGKPLQDETHRPQNQDPARPEVLRLYQDARALGFEADNYINACFLYRREAAAALGGRYADDLRGLEDYDFWLRLQKAGPFRHLRNTEPLYYYRVHRRTMSHEILSQEAERAAHQRRIERLLEYEAGRREFCRRRWTLTLDESLSPELAERVRQAAAPLALDIQARPPAGAKTLRVTAGAGRPGEKLYARRLAESWQLCWQDNAGEARSLELWAGVEIHPQAWKARQHRKNIWEFAQAGERPILGLHWGLGGLPLDLPRLREVIEKNPGLFFVFADTPGEASPETGRALVAGLENATYLGPRPFGEAYPLYACFDAFWLPPVEAAFSEHAYRSLLALAYAAGRPLLAPRGFPFIPAPYQFTFDPPDDSLLFVQGLRAGMDPDLLDRYLQDWTPGGALGRLLRLADAAAQELALPRPDFELLPPPVSAPQPWEPARPAETAAAPLKAALLVDSLDKGGLEELVAQFARRLPECGAETFVLCVRKGGETANALRQAGVEVYIADGDLPLLQKILQREKPQVVNSHWAGLESLQAAAALGLPVVETIHSSYIWLDREEWENEARRSRFFTRALATSENTRRFYLKWNRAINPAWVEVVPNGIDPGRVVLEERGEARRALGLDPEDFLFLCLASYDGAKNQLGILSAFAEVARRRPQARLLCAGNAASPDYLARLRAYRERLPSRERIELQEFRQDIGRLLCAADAFVLNSFSEGWSLAATEALLAGTPLIHSDCGSAWELVGRQGERGIVTPNPVSEPVNLTREAISAMIPRERQRNTAALVQAMERLMDEREQWEARRPEIQAYAREHFRIEHTLEAYVKVFRQVAYGEGGG